LVKKELRAPRPFYLSIKNPLRMWDLGHWDNFNALHSNLVTSDVITWAEGDEVWKAWNQSDAAGWHALKDVLKAHGYDGIVYKNEAEGFADSYIAFDNDQIKPAKKLEHVAESDCGANGPGGKGFQPGNTCAKGGALSLRKTHADAGKSLANGDKVTFTGGEYKGMTGTVQGTIQARYSKEDVTYRIQIDGFPKPGGWDGGVTMTASQLEKMAVMGVAEPAAAAITKTPQLRMWPTDVTARVEGKRFREATGKFPFEVSLEEFERVIDPENVKWANRQENSHFTWVKHAVIYAPDRIPDNVLFMYAKEDPSILNELQSRRK
jgi:hypothetical protein